MTKLSGMTKFVWLMGLIRIARDSEFIISTKNTDDKTSSPQRKLGSRPSHQSATRGCVNMPGKADCGGWPVVCSGAVSGNEISSPRLAWTPDFPRLIASVVRGYVVVRGKEEWFVSPAKRVTLSRASRGPCRAQAPRLSLQHRYWSSVNQWLDLQKTNLGFLYSMDPGSRRQDAASSGDTAWSPQNNAPSPGGGPGWGLLVMQGLNVMFWINSPPSK